jgi:hypothetical protein
MSDVVKVERIKWNVASGEGWGRKLSFGYFVEVIQCRWKPDGYSQSVSVKQKVSLENPDELIEELVTAKRFLETSKPHFKFRGEKSG